MKPTSNILFITRGITKLYEQYLEDFRRTNKLSQVELTIISFLYNNPEMDTASDIVEMRMLQKGNVSQGVESLINRGLLRRNPDSNDRRRNHLSLTDDAIPLVEEIELQNKRLFNHIFSGFSKEEHELYTNLNERIYFNVINSLGKDD